MTHSHFEVAIIGAGMAGLTCAQRLHQAGYRVVVVDKSRGLGGRMATRRLHNTHADHGVCYLKPKNDPFKALLETLLAQTSDHTILRTWTDTIHELNSEGHLQEPVPLERFPRYASAIGITAIAKFLGTGLTILPGQRVERIRFAEQQWHLQFETQAAAQLEPITAQIVVVAIPAPQALVLLEPLAEIGLDAAFLAAVESVQFSPCISAIAVYPRECLAEVAALPWKAAICPHDSDLAWVGIDSSKQISPAQPVFVVQSNADFANRHSATGDLQAVGQQLLNKAARSLLPWLAVPQVLQVHRWRYAFPINSLAERCLPANLPLVCAGDWCGGNRVESAFDSGLAAAEAVNSHLQKLPLPEKFWEALV